MTEIQKWIRATEKQKINSDFNFLQLKKLNALFIKFSETSTIQGT